MQIQFFGAVRTVTGSQHMLTVNRQRILLDCGLYQGRRQESYERNVRLPYPAAEVDVMVLSHAHIDHSGNIPNLVKSGFRGDIICTTPTYDLSAIMLRDSAHIQEADAAYLTKRFNRQQGPPPVGPLYTLMDAAKSLRHFTTLAYGRSREIAPGVQLTFYDAGHILGSAIVVLEIEDQATKQSRRLVFSGDLGRSNRPILADPTPIESADILLIESTYGDREHENDDQVDEQLTRIINDTVRRSGKVIVPAFAVGRTQELVYRLHRLIEAGKISANLPVYVDSPLALDATSIYRLHSEVYDAELTRFLKTQRHGDPFGFDRMVFVQSVEESKALNRLTQPAVIISASGMAEAGRILHHLANNIEDPRNTILIVGWQAPDTLGRRLVDGVPRVRILGDEYKVKAEVQTISGLSAHADRGELLSWVSHFEKPPSRTFVVHGDEPVSLAFADTLRQHGLPDVVVPTLGQLCPI